MAHSHIIDSVYIQYLVEFKKQPVNMLQYHLFAFLQSALLKIVISYTFPIMSFSNMLKDVKVDFLITKVAPHHVFFLELLYCQHHVQSLISLLILVVPSLLNVLQPFLKLPLQAEPLESVTLLLHLLLQELHHMKALRFL